MGSLNTTRFLICISDEYHEKVESSGKKVFYFTQVHILHYKVTWNFFFTKLLLLYNVAVVGKNIFYEELEEKRRWEVISVCK